MLPSIKISLPLLFVLWCIVAVWKMPGMVMLAYPLMWAAVAGLFLLITKLMGSASAADAG